MDTYDIVFKAYSEFSDDARNKTIRTINKDDNNGMQDLFYQMFKNIHMIGQLDAMNELKAKYEETLHGVADNKEDE